MSKEEDLQSIRDILSSEENLRDAADALFDANDKDGTGFIEREEFYDIVVQFSQTMEIPAPSNNQINEIITSLDSNNDGKFSKNEFKEFIKLLLQSVLECCQQ